MLDKEKELYFMCCISRDRGIKADYFDFDKRGQIADFTQENKEVSEDAAD